jgi:hypothetical protein
VSGKGGPLGEQVALAVLELWGWTVIEQQVDIAGHRLDATVTHDRHGDHLVEVKTWLTVSGRDTVKKALADAWDLWALRQCGHCIPPYMLVVSEPMTGLHAEMLKRAQDAGAIAHVVIIPRPEGLPT